MMKNLYMAHLTFLLFFFGCGQGKENNGNIKKRSVPICGISDSIVSPYPLLFKMRSQSVINLGSDRKLNLSFTVINRSDSTQRFCKWHTPFEPLISNYLEIVSSDGIHAKYKGILAKRVMPPPDDSFLNIPAGDSVTSIVDILKVYNFSHPGKYIIRFTGGEISGLKDGNDIALSVKL